jgi:hypothetical protein
MRCVCAASEGGSGLIPLASFRQGVQRRNRFSCSCRRSGFSCTVLQLAREGLGAVSFPIRASRFELTIEPLRRSASEMLVSDIEAVHLYKEHFKRFTRPQQVGAAPERGQAERGGRACRGICVLRS